MLELKDYWRVYSLVDLDEEEKASRAISAAAQLIIAIH